MPTKRNGTPVVARSRIVLICRRAVPACRRYADEQAPQSGPVQLGLISATSPTFSTRGKRRAKSIGVYRKSPLQDWDLGASGPLRGRDARRWLRRQIELE